MFFELSDRIGLWQFFGRHRAFSQERAGVLDAGGFNTVEDHHAMAVGLASDLPLLPQGQRTVLRSLVGVVTAYVVGAGFEGLLPGTQVLKPVLDVP